MMSALIRPYFSLNTLGSIRTQASKFMYRTFQPTRPKLNRFLMPVALASGYLYFIHSNNKVRCDEMASQV